MSDPFEQLGLTAAATPADVKKRWYELAHKHHPDHGGDAEQFQQLHAAYKAAHEQALNAPCAACAGTGKVSVGCSFNPLKVTCNQCGGTGKRP